MSTATVELTPDAYHDRPWADLFPWLGHHAPGSIHELADITPAPDWWLTESPAVTTMSAHHEDLCRVLAEVLITRYPDTVLGVGVPTLPVRLPLTALAVGSRARTAFQRIGAGTVGDLAGLSIQQLFAVRGTGLGTVEEITAALIGAAIIRQPELSRTRPDAGDAAAPEAQADTRPPGQLQLLDDLTHVATWRHIRGHGDAPLFDLVIEDGAPEEIQAAALRINSLTAADVAPRSSTADPVAEFTATASRLDDRQRTIIRERLLAADPLTLNDLGERLGITRERARQLEKPVKEFLVDTFHFGTAIGNLLASLRVEIQPVASLGRLVELHPELAHVVPGFDVPLWLVLDRLDDYFEVTGGWAAAPHVDAAWEVTRTLLQDFADEHGVVDILAVTASTAMPESELVEWLQRGGYIVHEGRVLTRTRSAADQAAGLLAIAGQPLTVDAILSRMKGDRSGRGLTNALSGDERFIRTDRSTWGLRGWEVPEYTPIREQIAQELSIRDRVRIEDLVELVTGRFNVSPASVHTYASSGDFEVVDGYIQRRTAALPARKEPADTRRLFQHGGTWRFRVVLTRDHLRGSGFAVPAGVAALVGCKRGDVVQLQSRLGPQTIRWTGPQPGSGTIRRFLEGTAATEGQYMFLEFLAGGRFDVSLNVETHHPDDPLRQALMLIGATTDDGTDAAPSVLAQAVCLPADAEPQHILAAYRRRGDDDVADILEATWTPTPAAQRQECPT